MKLVVRKLNSVKNLLINEQFPLEAVVQLMAQNWRQLILHNKHGKAFVYSTQLGFQFVCIPESKTSAQLYIHKGDYEDTELTVAQKWLKPGDVCIDLGANIGFFSALAAQCVLSNGKVFAVEASKQTANHLRQTINTLALKQVLIENVCITDSIGYTEFLMSEDGSADVRQSIAANSPDSLSFKKELVESKTVDYLIDKYKVTNDVSLVKMDIEGAEPLALRGGNTLFQKDSLPLFIVEIYKLGLARLGFEPKDILNFFSPDLFQLYHVNRSHPNPLPEYEVGKPYLLTNISTHSWPWHTNLIAIPKVGKYAARFKHIESYLHG